MRNCADGLWFSSMAEKRASMWPGSICPFPTMFRRDGWRRVCFRRCRPSQQNPQNPNVKMFDPDSIIVGLEIGTSKICAVVGEVNPSGALNIVGLGQARSRGVRKGEIADASTVAEDIRGAIVEAE